MTLTTAERQLVDINELPSLKDGYTIEEEAVKRRKTCRFIEEAARPLKLPRVCVATAMVFFHRFYAKHSFETHDRFEVAVACLMLAAKTEENPRKVNHVIDECYKLKMRGMAQSKTPPPSDDTPAPPMELNWKSEEFKNLKERILLLERVTLHTIGFELSVDHPFKYLVEQINTLVTEKAIQYVNKRTEAKQILNEMVQYSMNFCNDSMQTSLCLQYSSPEIASACVYLASQFADIKPTTDREWSDLLNCDVFTMGNIAVQILELIAEQRKKGMDKSLLVKIRQDLEAMQTKRKPPPPPPPSNKRPPPPPPPPGAAKKAKPNT